MEISFTAVYILTFVELATELVVRTALHYLGDMLRLFVDRHGPDDGRLGRVGQNLDLDRTSLGDLTIQFLQVCWVLEYRSGEGGRLDGHGNSYLADRCSHLADTFIQSNLQLIRRSRGQSAVENARLRGLQRAQQLHGYYCGYTGAWTNNLPVPSHVP